MREPQNKTIVFVGKKRTADDITSFVSAQIGFKIR